MFVTEATTLEGSPLKNISTLGTYQFLCILFRKLSKSNYLFCDLFPVHMRSLLKNMEKSGIQKHVFTECKHLDYLEPHQKEDISAIWCFLFLTLFSSMNHDGPYEKGDTGSRSILDLFVNNIFENMGIMVAVMLCGLSDDPVSIRSEVRSIASNPYLIRLSAMDSITLLPPKECYQDRSNLEVIQAQTDFQ